MRPWIGSSLKRGMKNKPPIFVFDHRCPGKSQETHITPNFVTCIILYHGYSWYCDHHNSIIVLTDCTRLTFGTEFVKHSFSVQTQVVRKDLLHVGASAFAWFALCCWKSKYPSTCSREIIVRSKELWPCMSSIKQTHDSLDWFVPPRPTV